MDHQTARELGTSPLIEIERVCGKGKPCMDVAYVYPQCCSLDIALPLPWDQMPYIPQNYADPVRAREG